MLALFTTQCGFSPFVVFSGITTRPLSHCCIVEEFNLQIIVYIGPGIAPEALDLAVVTQESESKRIQHCDYNTILNAFWKRFRVVSSEKSNKTMPHSILESINTVIVSLLRFLDRWIPNRLESQAPQNPYPFGSREWRDYAAAQATENETMVLRIADLEAQVQQTGELVQSLEVLASHQDTIIRDLRLQNRTLRDGPDPELFERIWQDLHKPLKKHEQPSGPEPDSSGPSGAPVTSVAEPSRTSDGGREPSQRTAAGQKTVTHLRPLTLAEELDVAFDEDSEEEERV